MKNLFEVSATPAGDEVCESLLSGGRFRLERIVSHGHATPVGQWYDQDDDEWVVLLTGAARLVFEGDAPPVDLQPGDYLNIPAHVRHRVEWTEPNSNTVWLALHHRAEW
jgi:cupin 2 domain-containing protein